MSSEKLQKAMDLSHHLSAVSRARLPSPLKAITGGVDMSRAINMAGGLPSEDYFPFSNISADLLMQDSFSLSSEPQESSLSWLWKLFGTTKEKTISVTIPRYGENRGDISLATALQYGSAEGIPQLQTFIKDFVSKVYQPAYNDWTIMVHTGNTDAWSRVVAMLCDPGEGVLTEEWTYPSAFATARPMGVYGVPITMDKQGMCPINLRKVLSEWNESTQGKRPHVLYTVPIGQNPSGATMERARKQEIYDICVQYDVIIVEDDPYYFMQEGEYVPKAQRDQHYVQGIEEKNFIKNLAPSYLAIDHQGRVIRLDTFSKYAAPGVRLGWHTCNPMFAERLQRHGETSAQAPCGFSQTLVTKLLLSWKYDGYVRWLHGLQVQYKIRRDIFIDAFEEDLDLQATSATNVAFWRGLTVYNACVKSGNQQMREKSSLAQRTLFSFVPPTSGMFLWIVVHLENHASFGSEPADKLEMQLWVKLVEAGIVISPGWIFGANEQIQEERGTGHFRISFSNANYEQLRKCAKIFTRVTQEFFLQ